ncbi:MAG: hypothetical protein F4Z15_02715 [Gammaproteobacteria bacterium]|nr:hypothetical protein [Gammaproteobacteria bacterium]MYD75534.1 hypothetical protein [Gammaproteobacteria bacterium]MYJ53214.1 hypothetical protein [Gammaproteobacteria bacterium]
MSFLKNLFASSRPAPSQKEVEIYKGFRIQPCPSNRSHGWTTEAIVTMEKDGTTQTHKFIRADISFNRDDAVQLSLTKARAMIDQMGERIFRDPR